jgi:hypothetical protein
MPESGCAAGKIVCAEIRAGEMLAEMKERGERADKGGSGSNQRQQKSRPATFAPKLSDLVTKTQRGSRT